ncbi:hypothetical protein N9W34_05540 [Rickettsiales bacterium]|nr:hypothetical protein [Rickettsiales bacterium]
MFKNLIITTLIILISLSASADDYDNFNSDGKRYKDFNSTKGDKYRDWNNVRNMLKAKGIDVLAIDWNAIETGCQEIKNRTPEKYNKCKYDNAINYSDYTKDIDYCNAAADQKYFDYMQSNNTSFTANNSTITLERSDTSLNRRQQKEYKYSYNVLCMRNLGWDGGSWIGGKGNNTTEYKRHKYGR